MKKVNAKNKAGVEALSKLVGDAKDLILIDYRGLSVAELTAIRKDAKKKGATLKITKNNLMRIALKEKGKPDLGNHLLGPTAVLFCTSESGAIAKELFKTKTELQDKFTVKCGIIDGAVMDAKQLEAYSKLPTKEEAIASLLGSMSEVIASFLRTLDAYRESKEAKA